MSLDYKKFLLFGDSITEFAFNTRADSGLPEQFSLGAALVNAYTRKLDIVQRGFSGYTSRWGLKLLPKILENEGPNVVMTTIFFGSNDAVQAGPQAVELSEFKKNINSLTQLMLDKGIKPILIGPALHDKEVWEPTKPQEVSMGYVRSSEANRIYADAVSDVAAENKVPFVDLHKAFTEKGGDHWQELLLDGVHFSGKGYEVFFDELLKAIRGWYPELAPERIPYKLPNWREVKNDGSNLDELI
ncbi:LAMI_0E14092g1_1 [Lachancea mirantina]|uniref:LAMI_0E14092g1_1 n=1 Tax=Lachancea mirantina TaxID=1230905 RepID=A0A1G4JRA8_9SACH|nr:LAMI_0E14092g1_1 [Lachancea mirantina]